VFETNIELTGTAKLGFAGVADLERACTKAEEETAGKELCEAGHAPIKLAENEELGKKSLVAFPKTLIKTEFVEEGKVVNEVKEGMDIFGKVVTKFVRHTADELTGVEDWGVFGK